MKKNKVIILGKAWKLTLKEIEFVELLLGKPQTILLWGDIDNIKLKNGYMEYIKKEVCEDKEIDKKILEYGVRKLGRKMKLSATYLSALRLGRYSCSESMYRKIKNALKLTK